MYIEAVKCDKKCNYFHKSETNFNTTHNRSINLNEFHLKKRKHDEHEHNASVVDDREDK